MNGGDPICIARAGTARNETRTGRSRPREFQVRQAIRGVRERLGTRIKQLERIKVNIMSIIRALRRSRNGLSDRAYRDEEMLGQPKPDERWPKQ
jgi:hypothetical protein